MKAVIFATGYCPYRALLGERFPTSMLQVVDRPFIQHVIEYLVDGGIGEFDFVLSEMPEKIEEFLGDGTRWGSTFRFHLAQDPIHPYTVLKRMARSDPNTPCLLGHADRLPRIPIANLDTSALFCYRDALEGGDQNVLQWTGWAYLPGKNLAQMPDRLDRKQLESRLMSAFQASHGIVEVNPPLDVRSSAAMLATQRRVMAQEFTGLILSGMEREPGIRLSRNVSISPAAQLVSPVQIGENCRIGAGVRLGPNAVIGSDCVLDRDCVVENAMVMPGSYVGEGLEVNEAIVDKNRLVNVRIGAAVTLVDPFILSSISARPVRDWAGGMFSRLGAAASLFFLWPLLLATACCLKLRNRGAVFCTADKVRLPTSCNEAEWRTFAMRGFNGDPGKNEGGKPDISTPLRHFFFLVLPALPHVIKGDVHLVGVLPRTRSEIRRLPHDWKALYVRAKPGIITEAYIRYGAFPGEDELFASEAFAAVSGGLRYEFGILKAYMGLIVKAFFNKLLYWKASAQVMDPGFARNAESFKLLKTENST